MQIGKRIELASKEIDDGSRQDYSGAHAAGGLPSSQHGFGLIVAGAIGLFYLFVHSNGELGWVLIADFIDTMLTARP